MADLIESLTQPSAFFVRLLDDRDEKFAAVTRFFSEVVVPVVREIGYEPVVMGEGRSRQQWMDVEIFERLSRCQMAVVDLTGLRNNGFMELVDAYGRGVRVLLSAAVSAVVPFDATMVERHTWGPDFSPEDEIGALPGLRSTPPGRLATGPAHTAVEPLTRRISCRGTPSPSKPDPLEQLATLRAWAGRRW